MALYNNIKINLKCLEFEVTGNKSRNVHTKQANQILSLVQSWIWFSYWKAHTTPTAHDCWFPLILLTYLVSCIFVVGWWFWWFTWPETGYLKGGWSKIESGKSFWSQISKAFQEAFRTLKGVPLPPTLWYVHSWLSIIKCYFTNLVKLSLLLSFVAHLKVSKRVGDYHNFMLSSTSFCFLCCLTLDRQSR